MEWIRCVFREGYAMVSRVIFILLFLLFIIYVHNKKLILFVSITLGYFNRG